MADKKGGSNKLVYRKIPLPEMIRVTKLVNLAYYRHPNNFIFSGESHNFWELVYIDKGELLIVAGEEERLLKQGELIFHHPNEFHAINAAKGIAANIIVASFVCTSAAMRAFKGKVFVLTSGERASLYSAVSKGAKIFTNHSESLSDGRQEAGLMLKDNSPDGELQLIKLGLEQILISLYQRRNSHREDKPPVSFEQLYRSKSIEMDIKMYLDANIGQKINLESIAEHCGYSVSHIKTVFKKQTGQSIIDFAISNKIEEAQRLIKEGSRNFTEIAEILGYDNFFYFSRLFKDKTGMTLTEFSRSIGKLDESDNDH